MSFCQFRCVRARIALVEVEHLSYINSCIFLRIVRLVLFLCHCGHRNLIPTFCFDRLYERKAFFSKLSNGSLLYTSGICTHNSSFLHTYTILHCNRILQHFLTSKAQASVKVFKLCSTNTT